MDDLKSVEMAARRGVSRRVLGMLGICGVVTTSLLVFPSGIPAMTAFWIGWWACRLVRETLSQPLLLVCIGIVLVKRVTLTPTVLGLTVTMAIAAILDWVLRRRQEWTTKRRWATVSVLALMWLYFAFDWYAAAHSGSHVALDSQRPVLCVGDSLTSGIAPYGGYPADLQNLLSFPVVNFGREGITSSEALDDLPKIVAANPLAVVIELGGHDFLKGHSRHSTKANIEKLIHAARGIKAEVMLFEVPRGFITDPFAGIEREIAREQDVELLSDGAIRKLVLWSPIAPPGMWAGRKSHLSEDGLHPNANGNIHLARRVAGALERVFGRDIRSR